MKKIYSCSEVFQHSVVKIQVEKTNNRKSTGTGFFFQYKFEDGNTTTVLCTNKHVIQNGINMFYTITLSNSDGTPNYKDQLTVQSKGLANWLFHPDKEVDLAIQPVSHIFEELFKKGNTPFYAPMREEELPNYEETEIYKPFEDIYMAGYPRGLHDETNNLPLIRRGITSTPFFVNFNGKKEFLIDCACFPGSSGSPIAIVNEGSYSLHKQTLRSGNRLVFLGILYAGPKFNAKGEIIKMDDPSDLTKTQIPMNVGNCIQSRRLLDFKPTLEEIRKNS